MRYKEHKEADYKNNAAFAMLINEVTKKSAHKYEYNVWEGYDRTRFLK
jgi:hypothetical protein